jgi:hypothetical protein
MKLIYAVLITIWSKVTNVQKNWWKSTPGYKNYMDRPDYIRYQEYRGYLMTRYPKLDGFLHSMRLI